MLSYLLIGNMRITLKDKKQQCIFPPYSLFLSICGYNSQHTYSWDGSVEYLFIDITPIFIVTGEYYLGPQLWVKLIWW